MKVKNLLKNFSIHVNQKDDLFFKNINDWWNPTGGMRTLHSYNELRIKYIKEQMFNLGLIENEKSYLPFDKYNFLDIGCGGGLLCESLARLGGKVTGIDSNSNSYDIANSHLHKYKGNEGIFMKERIAYFNGSTDDYMKENKDSCFDIITAMEVIEHVNKPSLFLKDINSLLKPGGYVFISTINRNLISYITTIKLAEDLTGIIPKGTHEWEKFITVDEMNDMLNGNGFTMKDVQGVYYNILTENMGLISNTSINYILVAKKNI
jgi:ubiquinone biosynthesis O-methyltransferase